MHETIDTALKNAEEETVNSVLHVVTETGTGFGEGSISTKAQIEKGTLTENGLQKAKELMTTRFSGLFAKIAADITDDGCGDGRPTADTYVVDDEGNEIHYNKSYPRAKVFGGGLIVASSMWRVLRGNPSDGETVLGDRRHVAGALKRFGIEYGAHSDEHAHGDACGCGAIDKYPAVTANILAFEPQIRAVLEAKLYGDTYSEALGAIDQVFAVYRQLAASEEYFADAAGNKTMQLIESDGAVVKKLGGEHEEDLFVLNDIEGTTFDQPAFDALLKQEGVNEIVQVFAVDIWRGRMYADAMADAMVEDGASPDEREHLRQVAYADFLIRTLAVTATLTGGDLPGYAHMREGQENFALAA